MGILDQIYDALMNCTKCGFCQATCTTYRNLRDESYTARGRIQIIRALAEGRLELTPEYEKYINTCLTCHQCAVTCPSGVRGDLLVLKARQDLFEKKGLPMVKKIPLQRVLPSRKSRNLAFGTFRLVKGFLPKTYKGIDIKGLPVAKTSFLNSCRERYGTNSKPAYKVAFFVGCMIDHTLPKVAEAVVRVLNANNVEVIIPRTQECCGTPMYTYGDVGTAKKVAEKNIKIFTELGVDAIITACGSCGAALKESYPEIFEGSGREEEVKQFSAKVMDITEFLVDKLNTDFSQVGNVNAKVTYHDSCHLARGMGITAQPRKLLQSIPGVQFVEMKEADQCCGAAGMFQGLYPQLATQITENKINNIKNTGADIVAVDCPACLHRIQGGININNTGQKALHVVEILDAAYQKINNLKLAK